MYTLPASHQEMFSDPTELDVVCLSSQDDAEKLLNKFPSLTSLYTARMEMIDDIVRQFTHDREFFYLDEEGGVPPYIVETIAWRASKELVAKISESILQSLDD